MSRNYYMSRYYDWRIETFSVFRCSEYCRYGEMESVGCPYWSSTELNKSGVFWTNLACTSGASNRSPPNLGARVHLCDRKCHTSRSAVLRHNPDRSLPWGNKLLGWGGLICMSKYASKSSLMNETDKSGNRTLANLLLVNMALIVHIQIFGG